MTANKTLSRETVKKVIQRKLNEVSNRFYNINQGGCGAFALILGNLFEQLGFEYEYIVVVRSVSGVHAFKGLRANNAKLRMKDILNTGWKHIMVKWGGYYIDSEGFYDRINDWEHDAGCITKNELLEFLAPHNYDNWNSSFDRSQVPYIENELNKVVNKLQTTI